MYWEVQTALDAAPVHPQSLRTPEAMVRLLQPHLGQQPQEAVYAILMDRHAQLIGVAELGRGNPYETEVDLRAYSRALLAALAQHNAVQVVLAHNHPSGLLRFSTADRQLTQRTRLLAETLGASFVDHLLLSPNGRWISHYAGYVKRLTAWQRDRQRKGLGLHPATEEMANPCPSSDTSTDQEGTSRLPITRMENE